MPITIVLGALFGDEGKGRVTRELAREHDVTCRVNGGPNASHTIFERGEKWVLRQAPSGVFSDAVCLLGDAMLVDVIDLVAELEALAQAGVDVTRVYLSHRAHVILPSHKIRDRAREESLDASAIGTTRQGIGPAMADKVGRVGVRVEDLFDRELRATLVGRERAAARDEQRRTRGRKDVPSVWGGREGEIPAVLEEAFEALAPRVRDTGAFLRGAVERGARVLLEGAQATLLDLDHGCYPHVTASWPTASGLLAGAGLPPRDVERVIGVSRSYATRQARGFLGTEVGSDEEDAFRARVRDWAIRVGFLDLPALRYASRVNGFTHVVITKMDAFTDEQPVRVCTAYDVEGERTAELPMTKDARAAAVAVFEDVPGWPPLDDVRSLEGLPRGAKRFLSRIEEATAAGVLAVSAAREGALLYKRRRHKQKERAR